jgi:hypothetical protein
MTIAELRDIISWYQDDTEVRVEYGTARLDIVSATEQSNPTVLVLHVGSE